ncbi:MAG: permease [Treponema sp.]|nr:permease [Treponema sp.]
MFELIQRHFIYFWYYFEIQFRLIFGYWVIGMAIGSLVSVFGKKKINEMFNSICKKKLGMWGVIPASLLGIASPLCLYGTIPIAASFAEKGLEENADFQAILAAFMMSSILLNPQILFYTAVLGTNVFLIRFLLCFLCGITAGIMVRIFFKEKKFFNFSGFYSSSDRDSDPNIILRFLKNFVRNIKATGLFFLIGIVLSSLFQCYVPADGLANLFGSNRGFGVLMAATIGVPFYVCGGGTIPLLQAWLHHGMSLGSAAAFMITGPAAKITNLGALKIVLGIKPFVFYLLFVFLFAFVNGFVINLIYML